MDLLGKLALEQIHGISGSQGPLPAFLDEDSVAIVAGNNVELVSLSQPNKTYLGAQNTITALATCFNKNLVAYAARYTGLIVVYDTANRKVVAELESESQDIVDLSFTCDGKFLLSVNRLPSSSICVWNIASATCIYTNVDLKWKAAKCHPSKAHLVAAIHQIDGADVTVRLQLYTSATSAAFKSYSGILDLETVALHAYSLSRKQSLPWSEVSAKVHSLEKSSYRSFCRADALVDSCSLVPPLETSGAVYWLDENVVSFNSKGTLGILVGAATGNSAQIFAVYDQDAASQVEEDLFPLQLLSFPVRASFPCCKSGSKWVTLNTNGTLTSFASETPMSQSQLELAKQWHVQNGKTVILSPSGNKLLINSADDAILVLDLETDALSTLEKGLGVNTQIAVNQAFKYFVSVSGNRAEKIDLTPNSPVSSASLFQLQGSAEPVAASFNPLGLFFVVARANNSVEFYTAPNTKDAAVMLSSQLYVPHSVSQITWDRLGSVLALSNASNVSIVAVNFSNNNGVCRIEPKYVSVDTGASSLQGLQFCSDISADTVWASVEPRQLSIAAPEYWAKLTLCALVETSANQSVLAKFPLSCFTADQWASSQCVKLHEVQNMALYRFAEPVSQAILPPRDLNQGNDVVIAHIRGTHLLKHYQVPKTDAFMKSSDSFEAAVNSALVLEFPTAQWNFTGDVSLWKLAGAAQDILLAYHTNGALSVQHVLEESKNFIVENAHDSAVYPLNLNGPTVNGLSCLVDELSLDRIYTVGKCDGLVKTWEWKPQNSSQSVACSNATAEQASLREALAGYIGQFEVVSSQRKDSIVEDQALTGHSVGAELDEALRLKLQVVKERLAAIHLQNGTDPEDERLSKDELVLDSQERERLREAADKELALYEKQLLDSNSLLEKERADLLNECSDAMKVKGRMLKSFAADPHTGKLISVANFPQRIVSAYEETVLNQVAVLRHTDVLVQNCLAQSSFQAFSALQKRQEEAEEGLKRGTLELSSLLYQDIELNSDFRRRVQIQLLQTAIANEQQNFNQQFDKMGQRKRSELSKIEEMNEKMNEMRQDMKRVEALVTLGSSAPMSVPAPFAVPSLHDDEQPERSLQVLDEELHSPKAYTAEERAARELQLRREQERAKAAQQDDSFARGLNTMMGGALQLPKNELGGLELNLTAPSCIAEKKKDEWTDDERKLVAEYEKKLQVVQEEREKQKRSLEAAYRKLYTGIQTRISEFDESLGAFYKQKLDVAHSVLVYELKSRKLLQSCHVLLDLNRAEESARDRAHELWDERSRKLASLPEVKRELEKCRQILDSSSKKNKDLERLFKKEFQRGNAVEFASVLKIFKHREVTEAPPFPDSISPGDRERILEYRERKTAAEAEEADSQVAFSLMQQVASSRVEETESLRERIDRIGDELALVNRARYLLSVDLELLLHIKQSQVEMPQAAVVTDFSHALLIPRLTVEQLNSKIKQVGKGKIDAFGELRDYRKSISKIEWENAVLDFQAEDVTQKIRWVQLLRVSKQMQEYLHGGAESKQSGQIAQLETQAQYSTQRHASVLAGLQRVIGKHELKLHKLKTENESLEKKMRQLEQIVRQREEIFNARGGLAIRRELDDNNALRQIQKHRHLADMAKIQAQDLQLLEGEAERLRLQTYPSFPTKRPAF